MMEFDFIDQISSDLDEPHFSQVLVSMIKTKKTKQLFWQLFNSQNQILNGKQNKNYGKFHTGGLEGIKTMKENALKTLSLQSFGNPEISFPLPQNPNYKSCNQLQPLQIFYLHIPFSPKINRMTISREDDEYKPSRELTSKDKIKKRLIYKFLDKNTNSNKWTPQQNEKFLSFLQSNKELLECQIKRKKEKIFLQISKAIKTRSPDQCRSHHQKMIKHHGNIDGIIEHLNERLYGVKPSNNQTEALEKGTIKEIKAQESEKMGIFETSLDFYMLEENYRQQNIWSVLSDDFWVKNLQEMSQDEKYSQTN